MDANSCIERLLDRRVPSPEKARSLSGYLAGWLDAFREVGMGERASLVVGLWELEAAAPGPSRAQVRSAALALLTGSQDWAAN